MAEPIEKVSKYVADNCASYAGGGLCHMETDSSGGRLCPLIYNLGKRCNYAETSVIPGSAEIEALYYSGTKQMNVNLITCEDCSRQFERTSNRQKRCPSCAKAKRAKRQRQARLDRALSEYRSDV